VLVLLNFRVLNGENYLASTSTSPRDPAGGIGSPQTARPFGFLIVIFLYWQLCRCCVLVKAMKAMTAVHTHLFDNQLPSYTLINSWAFYFLEDSFSMIPEKANCISDLGYRLKARHWRGRPT